MKNEKRKYIKKKINESVISPSDSIEVDYLDYKLFEIHLQLAEKLGQYEQLEREIEVVRQEAERLTERRYDAVQRAEREFRDSSRDYT